MLVTAQLLRDIAQTTETRLTEDLAPAFCAILPIFQMDSVPRLAAWLGQTCIETDYWRTLVEYGGADAKYAPYYGRGAIQLTWDTNYAKMGQRLSLPLVDSPDLVATPGLGTLVGCLYWADHQLNPYADRGDISGVSRAINRGSATSDQPANAEAVRIILTERALMLMGAPPLPKPVPTNGVMSVKQIQAALHQLGYYNGAVDNIAGPQTTDAIKAFQHDTAGLKVDGVAGQNTQAALQKRIVGGI